MKYITIVSPVTDTVIHRDLSNTFPYHHPTEILYFYPDIKGYVEYANRANSNYAERMKQIIQKESVAYKDVNGFVNRLYAKTVFRKSDYPPFESSFAMRGGAVEVVSVKVVLSDGFEDSPVLDCVQITGEDLSRLSALIGQMPFMHPGQPAVFPHQGVQQMTPPYPQPYPTRVPTPPNTTGINPQSPYNTTNINNSSLYQNPFPTDDGVPTDSPYVKANMADSVSIFGDAGYEPVTRATKASKSKK